MVEEGVEIDGVTYKKGSEVHKAAVVGDTVGDPFKDTSGPSLNILLKLMAVVALVLAPSIAIDRPGLDDKTGTSGVEDPSMEIKISTEEIENKDISGNFHFEDYGVEDPSVEDPS